MFLQSGSERSSLFAEEEHQGNCDVICRLPISNHLEEWGLSIAAALSVICENIQNRRVQILRHCREIRCIVYKQCCTRSHQWRWLQWLQLPAGAELWQQTCNLLSMPVLFVPSALLCFQSGHMQYRERSSQCCLSPYRDTEEKIINCGKYDIPAAISPCSPRLVAHWS